MKVCINGNEKELQSSLTLLSLIEFLGFPTRGIAVELNRKVLMREFWEITQLAEGDRIEIVQAVGGG